MGSVKKHLIVVGGPTASGKTEWAIRLANHFRTVILSADARQFYREMNIGTAKPDEQELRQVPHHFIDNLSITEPYSVGDFGREALRLLDDLFEEYDEVVLAGGSGLYIKALCEGLDEFPEVSSDIRQAVKRLWEREGIGALQQELKETDPEYYQVVDLMNPSRLIRAISVIRTTGRPFSRFRRRKPAERSFRPIYLQLHRPRTELYLRIDRRVDQMIDDGLIDEARNLYPHRNRTSLQTVGYQELFEYFDGKIPLEEAVRLIKRNSRRYAKRQLTWMRREGHWKHIGPEDWHIALDYIDLVRKENKAIQQRPGDDPGLAGFPFPSPPAMAVCLVCDDEVEAAVPIYQKGKQLLIDVPENLSNTLPSGILELMIHEVFHCTEYKPAFVRIAPVSEPSLRKYGFLPVGALPGAFEDLFSETASPSVPPVLLFRAEI